jgi:undecaprenyl-diphosphatase
MGLVVGLAGTGDDASAAATRRPLAQMIKHLVGRPRPRLDVDWTQHLGPSLSSGFDSFPSGHTVTAFALAVVLSKAYPGGRHVYYALAAFIGISRIYLDSHYASDVFAGGVLGVVLGSFLYFRFFPKMVHLV